MIEKEVSLMYAECEKSFNSICKRSNINLYHSYKTVLIYRINKILFLEGVIQFGMVEVAQVTFIKM